MSETNEPRLTVQKHLNFHCDTKAEDIDNFFKSAPAMDWSLNAYIKDGLQQPKRNITFDQVLVIFVDSLKQINQLASVPTSVRSVCANYIK